MIRLALSLVLSSFLFYDPPPRDPIPVVIITAEWATNAAGPWNYYAYILTDTNVVPEKYYRLRITKTVAIR